MKIAHCAAWNIADSPGGTEVYVDALVRELHAAGVDQAVLIPRETDETPGEFTHEGVPTFYYNPANDLEFENLLARLRPDVFHLHAWTSTAGAKQFRVARVEGIPVVFTFHNYSPVCATDTLMRHGSRTCDGVIRKPTCSSCYLHNRGYARPEAAVLASAAALMAPFFRKPDAARRWRTLASMFAGFSRRRNELLELGGEAAALVVPAFFLRDVLVRNGVDPGKIVVSRQGVAGSNSPLPKTEAGHGLRVGFVGRVEYLKGADIIAGAVHLLPKSESITLDIIGPEGGVRGTKRDPEVFMKKMREFAVKDPRVRIWGALPYDELRARMASFDLLAVPSRWQETGPMTAMEAIALGVPVIGSDLGGIPETVKDGVNGRIVASLDPGAWSRALLEILENPAVLLAWKSACKPGRTMAHVAAEMLALYRQCLGKT